METIQVPVHHAFSSISGRRGDTVAAVVIKTTNAMCAAEWSAYVEGGGTVELHSGMNGRSVLPPRGRELPEQKGTPPTMEERAADKAAWNNWFLSKRWEIGSTVFGERPKRVEALPEEQVVTVRRNMKGDFVVKTPEGTATFRYENQAIEFQMATPEERRKIIRSRAR